MSMGRDEVGRGGIGRDRAGRGGTDWDRIGRGRAGWGGANGIQMGAGQVEAGQGTKQTHPQNDLKTHSKHRLSIYWGLFCQRICLPSGEFPTGSVSQGTCYPRDLFPKGYVSITFAPEVCFILS